MNNEFENKNNAENIEQATESNNAMRLRMLGDDASENIHLQSDAEVKGAFWPNFWYKYKWHVIIISAFLFTFLVIFVQYLTSTKYDVHIVYVGSGLRDFATPEGDKYREKYLQAFTPLATDRNGDGEVNVSINNIVYLTPEQQEEIAEDNLYDLMAMEQANKQAYSDFRDLIMSGSMVFFLLDPSLYNDYSEAFGNINEILGYEVDSELLYAENAIYFKKTEFAKSISTFYSLPGDTILCVMTNHQLTPNEETEAAIELLKNIMAYEK